MGFYATEGAQALPRDRHFGRRVDCPAPRGRRSGDHERRRQRPQLAGREQRVAAEAGAPVAGCDDQMSRACRPVECGTAPGPGRGGPESGPTGQSGRGRVQAYEEFPGRQRPAVDEQCHSPPARGTEACDDRPDRRLHRALGRTPAGSAAIRHVPGRAPAGRRRQWQRRERQRRAGPGEQWPEQPGPVQPGPVQPGPEQPGPEQPRTGEQRPEQRGKQRGR